MIEAALASIVAKQLSAINSRMRNKLADHPNVRDLSGRSPEIAKGGRNIGATYSREATIVNDADDDHSPRAICPSSLLVDGFFSMRFSPTSGSRRFTDRPT